MTARAFVVLCGVLGTFALSAGELSTYRGFQFGMDLPAAAKQAGIDPSKTKVVHQRPALIQELAWQAGTLANARDADPLKEGLLCFYKSELYRIVVTYDRDRVEGLTSDDMIAAISATYGIATRPEAEITYHSYYGEVAQVIARWQDSQYSFNLVRSGYGDSFALVMYSKRLDALATAAMMEAVRLDAKEAPERAIEASRRQEQDDRLALEKARSVNAPNFHP
jgi:hypothetical protein